MGMLLGVEMLLLILTLVSPDIQLMVIGVENNLFVSTGVSTVVYLMLMLLGVESIMLIITGVSTAVIYLMLIALGVESNLLMAAGVSTVILLI